MTMISELSLDLVEEILLKIPITSLGAMRTTCKPWNTLSKDESFKKKHYGKVGKEFLVNMNWGDSFWENPRTFSLYNIKDLPSVKELGTMLRPASVEEIFKVYLSEGLFLCVPKDDNSRLMVWNPYLAQTRWIQTRTGYHVTSTYALGYDNNNNHKILRIFSDDVCSKYEIYDFKSNSRTYIGNPFNLTFHHKSATLKGNTYFVATTRLEGVFVKCFDFTTERFGLPLSLPFHSNSPGDVVYSCVKEEQLAVLHQKRGNTYELEIWITTKIEPKAVSWSKFFELDMGPLAGSKFMSKFVVCSFFIDKEKKVAIVSGRCVDINKDTRTSYVVGEDGYYKIIGLKGDMFSYTPSLVFI